MFRFLRFFVIVNSRVFQEPGCTFNPIAKSLKQRLVWVFHRGLRHQQFCLRRIPAWKGHEIPVVVPTSRSRSLVPNGSEAHVRAIGLFLVQQQPQNRGVSLRMASQTVYQPRYTNSWGLVIGINGYQFASPLGYARQDAEAFAEVLTTHHNFPEGVCQECASSRRAMLCLRWWLAHRDRPAGADFKLPPAAELATARS